MIYDVIIQQDLRQSIICSETTFLLARLLALSMKNNGGAWQGHLKSIVFLHVRMHQKAKPLKSLKPLWYLILFLLVKLCMVLIVYRHWEPHARQKSSLLISLVTMLPSFQANTSAPSKELMIVSVYCKSTNISTLQIKQQWLGCQLINDTVGNLSIEMLNCSIYVHSTD